MTKPPNTTTPKYIVYSLWNEDGSCLYVGITINLRRRLQEHARKAAWWATVHIVDPIEITNLTDARTIERALIRTYTPEHNIRHTNYAPHTLGRDLA